MKWIDKMSLIPLLVITVLMASLPMQGTSHLFEKLEMLSLGVLTRPIDIFDLLMHGTPAVLLAIRVVRQFVLGIKAEVEPEEDNQETDKK